MAKKRFIYLRSCPKCRGVEFLAFQRVSGTVDVIASVSDDGSAAFIRNPTKDGSMNTADIECKAPEGPFTCKNCNYVPIGRDFK